MPSLLHLGWLTAAAAALGLLLVLAQLAGIPAEELTPDPNSVAEQSAYVGVLSVLGVMLWGAAAASCLLAGAVLRGAGGSASGSRFLLATAALCTGLGVDDAAMIHENVAPDSLGVPQRAVLAGYLGLTLAWLVAFRAELRRSSLALLLCAAPCFAASLAIDFVDASRVVEDYFKYVGLFALAGWAFTEARRRLVAALGPRRERSAVAPTPREQSARSAH